MCVIIVCVLFLLAGLWWPFLCVCYYCLYFIPLSRFVMALPPTTDSRLFLPRSWLAFVCKIDERMHYVSMFMNCLFNFSLWVCDGPFCVTCVIIVCVLFLLAGLWWPSLQQQTRAFFIQCSWLAFVCKIDERMHYVSTLIFCLMFYFS